MVDDQEIYLAVGGDEAFFKLVDKFYEQVAEAPSLRELYPVDLEPGKKHLSWFLIQRFGGPDLFSERRGAPMLRRRHMPFAIDMAMRDLWYDSMMRAVRSVPAFELYVEVLDLYFADAATFLVNRMETKPGGSVLPQV